MFSTNPMLTFYKGIKKCRNKNKTKSKTIDDQWEFLVIFHSTYQAIHKKSLENLKEKFVGLGK